MCFNLLLKLQLSNDDKKLVCFCLGQGRINSTSTTVWLGVRHVGERIMLLNLAKGY